MNRNNQGRSGGRSGRGRGHGNNNNNNKNNKNKNKDERNEVKVPEEALKELRQNVYVAGKAHQADKFAKTTEVIMNCARANYERSEDIVMALRGPAEFNWDKCPDKPIAPVVTGKVDLNT